MKRLLMILGTSGDLILLIAIILFLAFSAFASPANADEGIENSYFSKEELKNIKYKAHITGCHDSVIYRDIDHAAKTMFGVDEFVVQKEDGIFLPYVFDYGYYDLYLIINFDRSNMRIFIPHTSNCVFIVNNRED